MAFTDADKQVVRELIAEYMAANGAALDNNQEIPIVGDISEGDGTTVPVVKRSSGQVESYEQLTLDKLGEVVAPHVPAEALDDCLKAITMEELNEIFYPSSNNT